jgi:hypothetical protein
MHGHSGDIGHHNTSSWRANPGWLMGFFYDLPMLPGGKTMKNHGKNMLWWKNNEKPTKIG